MESFGKSFSLQGHWSAGAIKDDHECHTEDLKLKKGSEGLRSKKEVDGEDRYEPG
jgi:hypothetical protein